MTSDRHPHPAPQSLAELWRAIWDGLCRAPHDRHSPLRQPTLASLSGGAGGAPRGVHARMVVLRGADRAAATLSLHSDRRADKVGHIAGCPQVALLFWDGRRRQQLRCEGRAQLESEGPGADRAWAALGERGQAIYRGRAAPGTVLAAAERPPAEGAGGAEAERVPDAGSATSGGRENFVLIQVAAERLDWLWLRRGGHRRARFVRPARNPLPPWNASWRVP